MTNVPDRRRILGFALLAGGLALLSLGASATVGLLTEHHVTPVAPASAPAPAAEGTGTTTATAGLSVLGLDVERSADAPVDLSGLRALPNGGATTVALPAGVAASLDLDSKPSASSAPPSAQGTTIATASQRLVSPVAQGVAIGAAAFTGAGLLAYFWSGAKSWAFRVFVLPLVPLYAKITRAEVFDNGVRERIFVAIKERPGISASDLARAAGVSWGTTIYHLEVLEQNRMVSSIRKGRHRRYFENGSPLAANKDLVAVLQNPVTAVVARRVQEAPGVTQKELAKSIGMSPQALHWHLARLVGAGAVRKERDGRVVRHFAAA